MASLTLQADAIRSALASIQTCTPTISASLKDLLQGAESENSDPKAAAPKSKTAKPSQPTKGRAAGAVTKPARAATQTAPPKAQPPQDDDGWRDAGLPSKEKAILATQVINATLKTLGDAAKNPSTVLAPAPAQPVKGRARKSLRRSSSMPMTPLQPRSLNRVSTSPTKASRSPPATTVSSGCLAMVECAKVAFSTLRSLSAAGKISLPELQIESGMSSFINKLVTLGLYDHATKELRMLKRRLESAPSKAGKQKTKAPPASESPSSAKTLASLFDYPTISGSSALVGLVITTQLQALRILYGLNKSSQLEGALPFLRPARQCSPLSLLLLTASDEKADRSKCARQLDSLAQSLLSLTPNVAASEDGVAVEPRLSPSPETALEIQAIALAARLHSWRLSGHKGDIDRELLAPLSRCLAAFSRRSSLEVKSKSTATNLAFNQIWQQMESMGLKPVETPKSPLTTIYQVLGAVSREAGNLKEATNWIARLRTLTTPDGNSAARCCCVTAQLLALTLKASAKVEQSLVQEVLDGLQGSLSGNTTELDELLVSICQLRKVATNVVLNGDRSKEQPSPARESLETLLLQLPRFVLRWLGKPPAAEGATKEFLRFGQRRQLLSKYIHQVLDSALMLIKVLLEESKMPWDLTDSVLQDSLLVLEHMGDSALSSQKDSPAASYYVKISHFYYQQHIALRKGGSGPVDTNSLRALRRSIDAVKARPEAEQSKSQLMLKQERLAELCRTSGRKDDAAGALRSIRDALVREDTVPEITQALSRLPLLKAWRVSNNAQSLSRTVCNLAKLEPKPCDWTWLLTGADKATAMEHDLYFLYSREAKHHQYLAPGEPLVDNLLQAFSAKDFPLRRLRTLLQLLVINLDSPEHVRSWVDEVKALREGLDKSQLGEDTGLSGYFEHLSSLAVCVVGLLDFDLCSPQVQEAIDLWTSRVTDCHSEDDLCVFVDNPEQLLTVLRSLSDFARVKGMDSVLGSILELAARVARLAVDDNPEMLVVQHTALSLQHLAIGHSAKAEAALKNGHEYLVRQEVSSGVLTSFHLCSAEYHMAVGNFDRAASHLADAHASGTAFLSDKSSRSSRISKKMAIAQAAFLQSILALERGNSKDALVSAKDAVRILYHDWAKLEALRGSNQELGDEPSQNESSDESGLGSHRASSSDVPRAKAGPEFWAMAYPLFRFLLRLSSIYAHIGMYQETIYYAEQAEKVARSTEAPSYILQSQVWLATVFMTAGQQEKAGNLASSVKESISAVEATGTAVNMACQLSRIFRSGADPATESSLLGMAESMIETIHKGNAATSLTTPPPEKEVEKPAVKPSTARKTTAASRPTRAKAPAATGKVAAKRQAPPAAAKSADMEDRQLSIWRASILQQRSESLLEQREWTEAMAALQEACALSKLSADITRDRLYTAMALIGQSLEQMGRDSVFSVIQDSTLSFPAVASALKEKPASDKASPPKAAAAPARKARVSPQDAPQFIETLRKAHECLVEAHSIAILNGDGGLVQRVAALLQNVFILMSTTAPARVSGIGHPAHATCSVELARNLTWRRERKTLRLDSTKTKAEWPMPIESSEARRTSLAVTVDVDRFQKEFVDIIPSSWNVVSVSLSDTKHDLCITKLQAGHSPFAIRLPLERASSRDADSEVFNFEQGRAELLDIIQIANRTCHDARDMSAKGAKSAWWAQREALDERMKDLMENIEQTWLGGFRGIFAQHHRRSDLLSRFHQSFQEVLNSNLPSRRQVRGKRTKAASATRVSLDPRILDLFIGLGDVTAPDCDLDEPLTDLLYFVVDILQFHGERNAYDEIDFDRMVVGTVDALHSYHAAAKSSKEAEEGTHTILVLDKSLHVFPWESLPCMQGLAVSRVPSLACLRRSIVEARSGHEESQGNDEDVKEHGARRDGHHIPRSSGTYILNPSADLKNTQSTFGKPLATLPLSWSAIEARAPTEAEFEKALVQSHLLLYFGHGSGAQYIRGRTIRKLDKCRAVALLMGCSSASLTTPGDFEPHGPVWNYMLAGSPAVVGTLWDVTDRDIDRYAGRLFEEWGLFSRGTFVEEGKGNSRASKKAKASSDAEAGPGSKKQDTSLVEAVAKARDACRFRYLTAAAVCVYGIPVYVGN